MSNYKILLAEIVNFKGVRHRLIQFDGRSAYLIGGNGKGKSSVIDAILSCINSKWVPTEPINNQIDTEQEREKGTVRLKIGEEGNENTYEILAEYVPSRKSGKLSMTENGVAVTGNLKDKVKQIFGEHAFDIYEFMHQSKTEQIKTLKELTGCAPQINALDSQRAEKLLEKNHVTKTVEEIQAVNKKDNRPFSQEDIRTYEKPYPTPVEEIQKEIEGIQPAIDTWNRGDTKRHQLTQDLSFLERDAEKMHADYRDIDEQIKKLQEKQTKITEDLKRNNIDHTNKTIDRDKVHDWLVKHPKPDLTDINKRLSDATAHNKQYELIKVYRERQEKLFKEQEKLAVIENEIKGIDQQKIDLIASSQLPVKGLSFDEKNVYLDGLPFEQNQINTAKYLEVGAEIAMSMNKKLKLVVLREATLIDDPHLQEVLKKINDRGYMWIAECVDRSGSELEIVFKEEDVTHE